MDTTIKDMKYDKGKILGSLPLKDFNLAILAIAEIGTFGANKYARSSWKTVPDAAIRYEDAMCRHQLMKETEENDPESGLKHLAHMAWNVLAILQLKLEEEKKKDDRFLTAPIDDNFYIDLRKV